MRTLIIICILLAGTIIQGYTQNTERFIRIIGNSKQTFLADGMVVNVTISEQQPNEHRQIKYKPFDVVYNEYIAELAKIGITSNQLVLSSKSMTKFSQTTTREYTLRLPSISQIEQLASISVIGAAITESKFTFSPPPADTEESLAKAAIEDARRKAKNLCAELNMKLGKILNIEDTSSGCCIEIEDANTNKVDKAYKVNVTFELADK